MTEEAGEPGVWAGVKILEFPLPLGLKPLNLWMENNFHARFETCSARNTTSVFLPLHSWMGFPPAPFPLPPAS
ncbi:hypothetical protein FACHB389_22240 [Nostoc calcicola FACHB-389]|nr:hypothetical protein FACHB389_22240 [Nostoc calcicola FACHB-389]